MTTYKGVFFDLHGTLLIYGDMDAEWEDYVTTMRACLSRFGLSISRDELAVHCDKMFNWPDPPPRGDDTSIFERRIDELGGRLGLKLTGEQLRYTAESVLDVWGGYLTLDAEAVPVLQSLKQHKTLALISNFDHPAYVHSMLDDLNLREYFDTVIVSGDVGTKKPDPAIFLMALEQTNLKASETLYVGDADQDVQGARAAGITLVLIRRNMEGESEGTGNVSDHDRSGDVKSISNLSKLIELLS